MHRNRNRTLHTSRIFLIGDLKRMVTRTCNVNLTETVLRHRFPISIFIMHLHDQIIRCPIVCCKIFRLGFLCLQRRRFQGVIMCNDQSRAPVCDLITVCHILVLLVSNTGIPQRDRTIFAYPGEIRWIGLHRNHADLVCPFQPRTAISILIQTAICPDRLILRCNLQGFLLYIYQCLALYRRIILAFYFIVYGMLSNQEYRNRFPIYPVF